MELRVRIVFGDENSLCKVVLLQPGLWCAFFLSFLQFHNFTSLSVRQGAA